MNHSKNKPYSKIKTHPIWVGIVRLNSVRCLIPLLMSLWWPTLSFTYSLSWGYSVYVNAKAHLSWVVDSKILKEIQETFQQFWWKCSQQPPQSRFVELGHKTRGHEHPECCFYGFFHRGPTNFTDLSHLKYNNQIKPGFLFQFGKNPENS